MDSDVGDSQQPEKPVILPGGQVGGYDDSMPPARDGFVEHLRP